VITKTRGSYQAGNGPELCEAACEQLTAADGLPDEDEDQLSDLDRLMATWGEDDWQ